MCLSLNPNVCLVWYPALSRSSVNVCQMSHACSLSTIPCSWCTENIGRGGILPMGSRSTRGIGRVKEVFMKRLHLNWALKDDWDFHLAEKGAEMGSYVLQAHDIGLIYYTIARNAWSSRESLIMEWVKYKNKKFHSHRLLPGSISRILIFPQCSEIGISHIRLPYLRKYGHSQPASTSESGSWPPRRMEPPLGSLRRYAMVLGFLSAVRPCHWGSSKTPTQTQTRAASYF